MMLVLMCSPLELIVTMFTVGENSPCDPPVPTYLNEDSGLLMIIARTELERRSRYMQNVNTKLLACGQFREDHPLIQLIQKCLNNGAHKRPNIGEVLGLLEEARAGIRDEESERNRVELVQALQNQSRNQVSIHHAVVRMPPSSLYHCCLIESDTTD